MTIIKTKIEENNLTVKVGKEGQRMEALQSNEVYKYLGMEQNKMTDGKIVKERLLRMNSKKNKLRL